MISVRLVTDWPVSASATDSAARVGDSVPVYRVSYASVVVVVVVVNEDEVGDENAWGLSPRCDAHSESVWGVGCVVLHQSSRPSRDSTGRTDLLAITNLPASGLSCRTNACSRRTGRFDVA